MRNLVHESNDLILGFAPQSIGTSTTVNGATTDRKGWGHVVGVFLPPATISGTVTFKLQEGDAADGSDMADITGASIAATGATYQGKALRIADIRTVGWKRYVRAIATNGATGANICATAIELSEAGGANDLPVSHTPADVVVTD